MSASAADILIHNDIVVRYTTKLYRNDPDKCYILNIYSESLNLTLYLLILMLRVFVCW